MGNPLQVRQPDAVEGSDRQSTPETTRSPERFSKPLREFKLGAAHSVELSLEDIPNEELLELLDNAYLAIPGIPSLLSVAHEVELRHEPNRVQSFADFKTELLSLSSEEIVSRIEDSLNPSTSSPRPDSDFDRSLQQSGRAKLVELKRMVASQEFQKIYTSDPDLLGIGEVNPSAAQTRTLLDFRSTGIDKALATMRSSGFVAFRQKLRELGFTPGESPSSELAIYSNPDHLAAFLDGRVGQAKSLFQEHFPQIKISKLNDLAVLNSLMTVGESGSSEDLSKFEIVSRSEFAQTLEKLKMQLARVEQEYGIKANSAGEMLEIAKLEKETTANAELLQQWNYFRENHPGSVELSVAGFEEFSSHVSPTLSDHYKLSVSQLASVDESLQSFGLDLASITIPNAADLKWSTSAPVRPNSPVEGFVGAFLQSIANNGPLKTASAPILRPDELKEYAKDPKFVAFVQQAQERYPKLGETLTLEQTEQLMSLYRSTRGEYTDANLKDFEDALKAFNSVSEESAVIESPPLDYSQMQDLTQVLKRFQELKLFKIVLGTPSPDGGWSVKPRYASNTLLPKDLSAIRQTVDRMPDEQIKKIYNEALSEFELDTLEFASFLEILRSKKSTTIRGPARHSGTSVGKMGLGQEQIGLPRESLGGSILPSQETSKLYREINQTYQLLTGRAERPETDPVRRVNRLSDIIPASRFGVSPVERLAAMHESLMQDGTKEELQEYYPDLFLNVPGSEDLGLDIARIDELDRNFLRRRPIEFAMHAKRLESKFGLTKAEVGRVLSNPLHVSFNFVDSISSSEKEEILNGGYNVEELVLDRAFDYAKLIPDIYDENFLHTYTLLSEEVFCDRGIGLKAHSTDEMAFNAAALLRSSKTPVASEVISELSQMGFNLTDRRELASLSARLGQMQGLADSIHTSQFLEVFDSLQGAFPGTALRVEELGELVRLLQSNEDTAALRSTLESAEFAEVDRILGETFHVTDRSLPTLVTMLELAPGFDGAAVDQLVSELRSNGERVAANDLPLLAELSRNPRLHARYANRETLEQALTTHYAQTEAVIRTEVDDIWGLKQELQHLLTMASIRSTARQGQNTADRETQSVEEARIEEIKAEIELREAAYRNFGERTAPSELPQLHLLRAVLLKEALDNDQTLRAIGVQLDADIADTTTEYGGVLQIEDGRLRFRLDYSYSENDGAFRSPRQIDLSGGIATFHQHALSTDETRFAGPSGGLKSIGGDIGYVKRANSFDVILTPLGHAVGEKGTVRPTRLAVNVDAYFVDERKPGSPVLGMVDLGRYEVPTRFEPKPATDFKSLVLPKIENLRTDPLFDNIFGDKPGTDE